ncbi:type III polyketide synthase [Peribacillus saganii]|uniref:Type III polyketide synthase n=1 Tax=Peribacillus saganii TaxID=2303992 RepID=A0A372LED9_9BACI|nr:3-oxoacyl-[acyl-carrier-protein] synthase III C-terminal domain-containing protein [Peribacillus saganii]RFU64071.1 type III polyketide synthase [Peribacillus saganii]
MPYILSASHIELPHKVNQDSAREIAKTMFSSSYRDIDRLLRAFENGQVQTRNFSSPLEWFKEKHTFEEKNNIYIEHSVKYGYEAIYECLNNREFLSETVNPREIDAFFFISSTGIATPSVDARIMNHIPFSKNLKRIPIWGLGCAGGAAGLSRAFEYCKAYPKAAVIVLAVELCSLTFQKDDMSKSNLIGTSLFSDGIACVLICGDENEKLSDVKLPAVPRILQTQSALMPNSLDVMGWELKNEGLFVVFSKDIPSIVKEWLKPIAEEFLAENSLSLNDIQHFVAHPGGKKVIEAYRDSLGFSDGHTETSMEILREYGNMSSATILYVLERFMKKRIIRGEYGLAAALGPGFSSEMLLMRWE